MPQTRIRAAWLAAGTVLLVSLAVRVAYRGTYYPGFDLAGAANGLNLVSTHPWGEAIALLWSQNRHYGAPIPYYSALFALLPGAATRALPWPWWGHLATFLCFATALGLAARAARLGRTNGWVVLLALTASPTLLALALCGMPWATAFLPHALALWLVLDPRVSRRPLVSLAGSLVALELSWHCYELGKTVPAVFAAAALLVPDVPRATRLAWAGTAVTGVALVLAYPSMHVDSYVTADLLRPDAGWHGLAIVARMLFVDRYLDQPTLVTAGLLACLVMTRTRFLLAGMLALQLVLLGGLAIAFEGGWQLRPRRFVMVDCYALALVATLFGETADVRAFTRAVRAAILTLLVAGTGWQLGNLAWFVRAPVEPRGQDTFAFTLPYSHSQVDYMVTFANVEWANDLVRRARRGEHLLLVYNLQAYDENLTNPAGILERLYVSLGHETFVERVFVFGASACRHNCLPIRPAAELEPFLDALAAGRPLPAEQVTGFVVAPQPMDSEAFLAERSRQLQALEARFRVRWEDPEGLKFRRFTVAPAGDPG